ncbi:MAG: AAA family ATPase [Bacteroidetes bacterium]|nr:AAA family ATPase [Bacteroidota bacterium]
MANIMGIRHIAFDLQKQLFPVSATAIRSDLLANWEYLPDSVKPYFCIKVAILGTESTGKTTLATALAKHYGCGLVLEAARGIVENSNAFSLSDLQSVVTAHTSNIHAASCGISPLIVIDTNLYTTLSYSLFSLEQELQVSASDVATNRADLCLYLCKDAPYFQDGTRLSEQSRDRLDDSHRKVLREKGIEFVEIDGNWNQRFHRSTQWIDQLLKEAHHRF